MTMNDTVDSAPRPSSLSPWIGTSAAYTPRRPDPRVRWFLDANEGRPSPAVVATIIETLSGSARGVYRYPSFYELEAVIAATWGVDAARVVATAGGDAFEMFGAYARSRGGITLGIRWMDGEAFPLEQTIEAIARCPSLGLATVVSPSNPTGGVVSADDALAVAAACADNGAAFLFDAAYGEFADDDPSPRLVAEGSAYVVRSFSKAYGLAGMRIGYAIAPDAGSAAALRSCGMPYPSSGPSCAAAMAALNDRSSMLSAVEAVRAERSAIAGRFRALGARVADSGANFVLARVRDPAGLSESMADAGVAIRTYGGRDLLADAVRVSCPCDDEGLAVVLDAIDRAKEYIVCAKS